MCDILLRERTLLELCEEGILATDTNDATLRTLISYREDFSQEAGEAGFYVGQINTAWHNAQDCHEGVIRDVREWCKLVISLLQYFESVEDVESRQIIIDAIVDGEQTFVEVKTKLEACQKNLNDIVEKIVLLQKQLDLDFDVHSAFYQSLIKKTRYQCYGEAAVGAIAASYSARAVSVAVAATSSILVGPLGICIVMGAVGIASIAVVEGKIRPQLLAHLSDIKAKFENIQLHTQGASAKIEALAVKLRQDLNATSAIKTKGTTAKVVLNLRGCPVDIAIARNRELSAACAKFIEDHPID